MKLGVIKLKKKKKKEKKNSPNGHVDFAYSRKPSECDTCRSQISSTVAFVMYDREIDEKNTP